MSGFMDRLAARLAAGESVQLVTMGDSGFSGPVSYSIDVDRLGFIRCDNCQIWLDLMPGEWQPTVSGCEHISEVLKGMRR